MLNPSQQSAIDHTQGPLLVLAGAGSGKTLVVTRRIARLIQHGTPARAILAMTFTNKAAAEMAERIEKLAGKDALQATIGTFHAFGLRVLRAEARQLGFHDGRFAIFDQADQASTVREILRERREGRRWDVHAILARISNAKNNFIEPNQYESTFQDPYDDITEWVYPRYVDALKTFHALDFDDLICEVVRLFRSKPSVLERWQSKYWFVMVDEYQDTNHAQFELVRLLSEGHGNLCVVGDDDQSIYGWRGADVRNILDFGTHFSGAKVVKLQNNYRSTEAILSVANAIIHASSGRRYEKKLQPTQPGGDLVRMVDTADADVEASFVGDEIRRRLDAGLQPRDIAVLYRSNLQSEPLETALRQRHIAYRVVGGTQFYERKEVKDLIAYLRVALHPGDELSLRRIINYPSRGIGQSSVERLSGYGLAHDMTFWAAVGRARGIEGLPPAAVEGCDRLHRVVERASTRLEAGTPSSEVAREVIAEVGMVEDIMRGSGSSEAAARRRLHLDAFLQTLSRFDASAKSAKPGGDALLGFLQLMTLSTDSEEDAGNAVTLTTMHGAKGLEFQTVFVVGLEEGLMPHARSLDDRSTDVQPHDIEEERRLFYVAVTRARSRLYLCHARTRWLRGKPVRRVASRFFKSIPTDLVQVVKLEQQAPPSMRDMLDGVEGLLAALEE
jgi:DNA helicase-2/ATP-dependent DNA helicase PcrA